MFSRRLRFGFVEPGTAGDTEALTQKAQALEERASWLISENGSLQLRLDAASCEIEVNDRWTCHMEPFREREREREKYMRRC